MNLPLFKLERYFARTEFVAPYMLSGSDCETLTIQELLDLEPGAAEGLLATRLGYTEPPGRPSLRRTIASLYDNVDADGILVHTGAEYEWVHTKPYRMAVHAILGRVGEALRDFRAAIDQGWRSILYGRFVRFEEAPMLRELHTRPEFQAMIDEIKQYNALMLADVDAADQRRAHRN